MLLIGYSNTTPVKQPIPPVHYPENPDGRPNHPQVITFYALGDWGTGDNRQIAVDKALKEDIALLESREEKRRLLPFVLGLGNKRLRQDTRKTPYFLIPLYGFVRFDAAETEMWVEFFSVDLNSSRYQSSALFKIPN